MPWGAAISAAGAIGGALINKKSAKDSAAAMSQQGQLDPRVAAMLFGENGNQGLFDQIRGQLNIPRSDAALSFAGANNDYLTKYGSADLDASRQAALKAMGGNPAPTASAGLAGTAQAALGAYASGSPVDAPAQNGLNLTGSYNSLINGPAGANPYLTGAIQKGINQSSNAFGNMLTDAKSATQDLLGNIRGGAIAAGQFGGSRQGIAEGKALDSFNTNMSRAVSQFGQNNTDAAVAAQAGAYNSDRDRQLAATQGLSGQQYATAFKNADIKNTAELTNVSNLADFAKYNAGLAQQSNLFNANQAQQSHQFNASLQQTNNAQNNASNLAGGGMLAGLLSQVGGTVNANDNWSLNRMQGVTGMLAPLLNGTPTQNPVSANSSAAALGGGLAGLGFGSQLASLFGNNGPSSTLTGYNGPGITAQPMPTVPQTQVPFMSRI